MIFWREVPKRKCYPINDLSWPYWKVYTVDFRKSYPSTDPHFIFGQENALNKETNPTSELPPTLTILDWSVW